MTAGDIDFLAENNTDVVIEDTSGKRQRASLVVVANGLSETNSPLDVALQDQTTPTVIVKFNKVTGSSTLSSVTTIGSRTINVVSGTPFTAGNYVVMYSNVIDRYYVGNIISVATNVLTLDTPLDYVFPVGSVVGSSITNLNVNGSITSQTFGLRGSAGLDPIQKTFDITRIIFSCLTDSAVSLAKFADLTALTNGLVLRRRNGEYYNIFNVKSNADIAGIMLDWYPYAATNPVQGQDGFTARLTFSGSEKLGVAVRLMPEEDLELIVQDDLTGITKLEIVAEGHEVE